MDKFVIAAGAALLTASLIFIFAIMSTIFGALGGWIVGLFFDDTILGIATQIGISDIRMWQLGAFLGFVGSFFKANVSTSK